MLCKQQSVKRGAISWQQQQLDGGQQVKAAERYQQQYQQQQQYQDDEQYEQCRQSWEEQQHKQQQQSQQQSQQKQNQQQLSLNSKVNYQQCHLLDIFAQSDHIYELSPTHSENDGQNYDKNHNNHDNNDSKFSNNLGTYSKAELGTLYASHKYKPKLINQKSKLKGIYFHISDCDYLTDCNMRTLTNKNKSMLTNKNKDPNIGTETLPHIPATDKHKNLYIPHTNIHQAQPNWNQQLQQLTQNRQHQTAKQNKLCKDIQMPKYVSNKYMSMFFGAGNMDVQKQIIGNKKGKKRLVNSRSLSQNTHMQHTNKRHSTKSHSLNVNSKGNTNSGIWASSASSQITLNPNLNRDGVKNKNNNFTSHQVTNPDNIKGINYKVSDSVNNICRTVNNPNSVLNAQKQKAMQRQTSIFKSSARSRQVRFMCDVGSHKSSHNTNHGKFHKSKSLLTSDYRSGNTPKTNIRNPYQFHKHIFYQSQPYASAIANNKKEKSLHELVDLIKSEDINNLIVDPVAIFQTKHKISQQAYKIAPQKQAQNTYNFSDNYIISHGEIFLKEDSSMTNPNGKETDMENIIQMGRQVGLDKDKSNNIPYQQIQKNRASLDKSQQSKFNQGVGNQLPQIKSDNYSSSNILADPKNHCSHSGQRISQQLKISYPITSIAFLQTIKQQQLFNWNSNTAQAIESGRDMGPQNSAGRDQTQIKNKFNISKDYVTDSKSKQRQDLHGRNITQYQQHRQSGIEQWRGNYNQRDSNNTNNSNNSLNYSSTMMTNSNHQDVKNKRAASKLGKNQSLIENNSNLKQLDGVDGGYESSIRNSNLQFNINHSAHFNKQANLSMSTNSYVKVNSYHKNSQVRNNTTAKQKQFIQNISATQMPIILWQQATYIPPNFRNECSLMITNRRSLVGLCAKIQIIKQNIQRQQKSIDRIDANKKNNLNKSTFGRRFGNLCKSRMRGKNHYGGGYGNSHMHSYNLDLEQLQRKRQMKKQYITIKFDIYTDFNHRQENRNSNSNNFQQSDQTQGTQICYSTQHSTKIVCYKLNLKRKQESQHTRVEECKQKLFNAYISLNTDSFVRQLRRFISCLMLCKGANGYKIKINTCLANHKSTNSKMTSGIHQFPNIIQKGSYQPKTKTIGGSLKQDHNASGECCKFTKNLQNNVRIGRHTQQGDNKIVQIWNTNRSSQYIKRRYAYVYDAKRYRNKRFKEDTRTICEKQSYIRKITNKQYRGFIKLYQKYFMFFIVIESADQQAYTIQSRTKTLTQRQVQTQVHVEIQSEQSQADVLTRTPILQQCEQESRVKHRTIAIKMRIIHELLNQSANLPISTGPRENPAQAEDVQDLCHIEQKISVQRLYSLYTQFGDSKQKKNELSINNSQVYQHRNDNQDSRGRYNREYENLNFFDGLSKQIISHQLFGINDIGQNQDKLNLYKHKYRPNHVTYTNAVIECVNQKQHKIRLVQCEQHINLVQSQQTPKSDRLMGKLKQTAKEKQIDIICLLKHKHTHSYSHKHKHWQNKKQVNDNKVGQKLFYLNANPNAVISYRQASSTRMIVKDQQLQISEYQYEGNLQLNEKERDTQEVNGAQSTNQYKWISFDDQKHTRRCRESKDSNIKSNSISISTYLKARKPEFIQDYNYQQVQVKKKHHKPVYDSINSNNFKNKSMSKYIFYSDHIKSKNLAKKRKKLHLHQTLQHHLKKSAPKIDKLKVQQNNIFSNSYIIICLKNGQIYGKFNHIRFFRLLDFATVSELNKLEFLSFSKYQKWILQYFGSSFKDNNNYNLWGGVGAKTNTIKYKPQVYKFYIHQNKNESKNMYINIKQLENEYDYLRNSAERIRNNFKCKRTKIKQKNHRISGFQGCLSQVQYLQPHHHSSQHYDNHHRIHYLSLNHQKRSFIHYYDQNCGKTNGKLLVTCLLDQSLHGVAEDLSAFNELLPTEQKSNKYVKLILASVQLNRQSILYVSYQQIKEFMNKNYSVSSFCLHSYNNQNFVNNNLKLKGLHNQISHKEIENYAKRLKKYKTMIYSQYRISEPSYKILYRKLIKLSIGMYLVFTIVYSKSMNYCVLKIYICWLQKCLYFNLSVQRFSFDSNPLNNSCNALMTNSKRIQHLQWKSNKQFREIVQFYRKKLQNTYFKSKIQQIKENIKMKNMKIYSMFLEQACALSNHLKQLTNVRTNKTKQKEKKAKKNIQMNNSISEQQLIMHEQIVNHHLKDRFGRQFLIIFYITYPKDVLNQNCDGANVSESIDRNVVNIQILESRSFNKYKFNWNFNRKRQIKVNQKRNVPVDESRNSSQANEKIKAKNMSDKDVDNGSRKQSVNMNSQTDKKQVQSKLFVQLFKQSLTSPIRMYKQLLNDIMACIMEQNTNTHSSLLSKLKHLFKQNLQEVQKSKCDTQCSSRLDRSYEQQLMLKQSYEHVQFRRYVKDRWIIIQKIGKNRNNGTNCSSLDPINAKSECLSKQTLLSGSTPIRKRLRFISKQGKQLQNYLPNLGFQNNVSINQYNRRLMKRICQLYA